MKSGCEIEIVQAAPAVRRARTPGRGAYPNMKAADNSPWIEALAELRQRATREGHCYQHVQAITVAIDQYAEKALGNRDYFLNKPYGIGASRKAGDVP